MFGTHWIPITSIKKYLAMPLLVLAGLSVPTTNPRVKPCADWTGMPGPEMGSGACVGNFHISISLPSAANLSLHLDTLDIALASPKPLGLGKGVSLSAERWFVQNSEKQGVLHTGIGRQIKFNLGQEGIWTADPTETSNWIQISANSLIEFGLDGVVYTYLKQTGDPSANRYLIINIQDRKGHLTSYARRTDGLLNSITFPDGERVAFHYSKNIVEKITDPAGNLYKLYHSPSGLLMWVKYPDKTTALFNYTSADRIADFTDTKGRKTTLDLDATKGGLLNGITNSDGLETTFTYTSNTVTTISPESEITEHFNDASQIIKQTTDELDSSWERDEQGRITEQTDPLRNLTQYQYVGDNRFPNKLVYPDGSSEEMSFQHTPTSSPSTGTPLVSLINFEGATAFRVSFLNFSGVRQTLIYYVDYAKFGLPSQIVTTTNQVAESTQYEYNEFSYPSKIVHRGKSTQYQYDATGNMTQITDWKNNPIYKALYDSNGRITQETDELGLTTSYLYTVDTKKISKITSPNGSYLSFTFDTLGRPLSIAKSDGTQKSFTYNNALPSATSSVSNGHTEQVKSWINELSNGGYSLSTQWTFGNNRPISQKRMEFDSNDRLLKTVRIE